MDVFVSNKNVNTKKKKKVRTHRIYFLAFNALSPNLREMYFISSGFEMTDDNRFFKFLRVGRKIKTAGDICKRALDIEFEQDWSVGL